MIHPNELRPIVNHNIYNGLWYIFYPDSWIIRQGKMQTTDVEIKMIVSVNEILFIKAFHELIKIAENGNNRLPALVMIGASLTKTTYLFRDVIDFTYEPKTIKGKTQIEDKIEYTIKLKSIYFTTYSKSAGISFAKFNVFEIADMIRDSSRMKMSYTDETINPKEDNDFVRELQ